MLKLIRKDTGAVSAAFAAVVLACLGSHSRFDAAGDTAILARELEQVSAQSYDVLRDPKKGRQFVPFNASVAEGAETYSYDTYDGYGKAEFVTDYASSPPRSDVFKTRTSAKMHTIWTSYGFTVDEMAAAAFSSTPLDRMRALVARESIEQKIDDIIATGDAARGIPGFVNNANIPTVTSTRTNLWVPVSGTAATNAEIFKDLNDLCQAPEQASAENFVADTLILPLSMKPVMTRVFSDNDPRTIAQVWLGTQDANGVKQIQYWKKLNTASALGGPRALAYKKSNVVFEFLLAFDYREEAPQKVNLETQVIARAKVGGLSIHYAYAMAKMDLDTEV